MKWAKRVWEDAGEMDASLLAHPPGSSSQSSPSNSPLPRRRHLRRWLIISLTAALAPILPTQADTVPLSPAKDNTLYEEKDGKFSNGAGQYLFTGNTAQGNDENTSRALLQFNLGVIPTNATVTNVTLTLYMSRRIESSSRTHTLHRVFASQLWM